MQQGIVDKTPNKGEKSKDSAGETLITNSETTIYENAVPKVNSDEDSETDHEVVLNFDKAKPVLSDDPEADTSEELMNVSDQFIADCAADVERCSSRESSKQPNEYVPSRGESMVREAEDAKLRIIATPGNDELCKVKTNAQVVEEHYMVVGAHLDASLKQKIANHEYVDFARLIPRDCIAQEDDHRMELVSRGGSTFFVPVADRENSSVISSFNKWEQAFRVFANIYTRIYPDRAPELVQYNHIIFTAAQSFTWDNVYLYDCEFRMHLSNFLERSWSIILQQA